MLALLAASLLPHEHRPQLAEPWYLGEKPGWVHALYLLISTYHAIIMLRPRTLCLSSQAVFSMTSSVSKQPSQE